MRAERLWFFLLLAWSALTVGWLAFVLHQSLVRGEPRGFLVFPAVLNVALSAYYWVWFTVAVRRRRAERAAEATAVRPSSR